MSRDRERPQWRNQRPWFEIWFAVLLDGSRRKALWVREDLFVPREGDGRATTWAAWFDADAPAPRAGKRLLPIERAKLDDSEHLIAIDDASLSRRGAAGSIEGLAWNVTWAEGRETHADVPAWVPAPTHAQPIVYDAEASGTVTLDKQPIELRGRASAMHLWGKRRVPTLQWIWAPWLAGEDDAALEIQAVSLRDTFAMGLATLRLDGAEPFHGRPATAAHASCLVTATVAGPRKLVHARAWAEPEQMVGYAYRDTDGRDLLVAQSDIGSAHYEMYTRGAPGAPWHLAEDRRANGGVAVEIHQHAGLPDVAYLGWDDAVPPVRTVKPRPRASDEVAWPDVNAIVALGLTYGDHVRETGQKLDPKAPPTSFTKHVRAFAPGGGPVRVPTADELFAALDAIEPGVAAALREKVPRPPAVMDYEGELAIVALDAIDEAALAAGTRQPLGIAAANDLTARVVQALGETREDPLVYWACAKSFPRFLPLAAHVWAPAAGLARMPELTLQTRVNGEQRQRASTKLLIYDLAAMVRAARAHLGRPLVRGDIILTGTPAGVGLRMSPLKRRVAALVKDRFRKAELLVSSYATSTALLRPGDVIEIDGGAAGRVRTRLVV